MKDSELSTLASIEVVSGCELSLPYNLLFPYSCQIPRLHYPVSGNKYIFDIITEVATCCYTQSGDTLELILPLLCFIYA